MSFGLWVKKITSIGDVDLFQVPSDPNGKFRARIGSIAIPNDGSSSVWKNLDGMSAWELVGSPGFPVESHKDRHVSGGADAFASDDFLEAIVARLRESGGPTTLTLGAIADGQFLQRSGSSLVGSSGVGGGTGVWFWGADDLGLTTTTRFLPPGYGLGLALTAQIDLPIPRAGTVKNLFIRQNSPGTGGSNVVYTLTKNGVDTALSVTIASSGTSGSDTANTIAVAQGDRIGIKVTKPLLLLTSPNQVTAGVEFTS